MDEFTQHEMESKLSMPLDRRAFLGSVAAGSALIGGCLGGESTPDGNEDDGGLEPDDVNRLSEVPDELDSGSGRQMERLDRGLLAVPTDDGVLVRWRLLVTESRDTGFVVYRDDERITDEPITESTNFLDPDGTTDATYAVAPIEEGAEGERSAAVETWDREYKRIPLDWPEGSISSNDERITYHANDASVADLTGDGSYDIVVKWTPSNAKDNSQTGQTSNVYLDGYRLDGTKLWRIDLGPNIRAGAHYTPFLVYDFDADGIAEVAVRTSDGSVDAAGTVIGDSDAEHANDEGFILEGPEFLSVFDGATGEELETVDFSPARGDICSWGDCWGNRGDRFLAGVAYLDGTRPSMVWGRGYYEKTMVAAFDYRDDELSRRWLFDSTEGNEEYESQGNHQLSIADVDDDGKDEIVYGAMVLDHDGTGLYSTGWGHGDALHVGDFDPDRDGLEAFQIHEGADIPYQATFRDAETGELLWGQQTGTDTGRGMIADIDPTVSGAEAWATSGAGLTSVEGEELLPTIPRSVNFGIWWTGDRQRELLDHNWQGNYGVGKIEKWDHEAEDLADLVRFDGTRSNNWTKGNPCIQADILGDWREEVIWRENEGEALRLYATTHETDQRLYTLMHNPQYRLAVAWQNSGYNQPPWPSYHLGEAMDPPPRPDVTLIGGPE